MADPQNPYGSALYDPRQMLMGAYQGAPMGGALPPPVPPMPPPSPPAVPPPPAPVAPASLVSAGTPRLPLNRPDLVPGAGAPGAPQAEDPIKAAEAAIRLQQYREAMRTSPGYQRPAKWVPRSVNATAREPLPEETVAELDAATYARGEAGLDVAEEQRRQAEAIAVQREQAAEAQLQQVEADRARRQAIDARMTDLMRKHDDEAAALSQETIDPNRWFNSRNAAGKVAAVVGAILIGAGGGNPGDMVRMLSEQDIDAQKATMALRERGVQARITTLEQLTAAYGSPQAAEALLRERQAQAIDQRLAATEARLGAGDVARAQIAAARAALVEEIAMRRAQFQEASLATVEKQTVYDPGGVSGGKKADLEAAAKALAQYRALNGTDAKNPYTKGLDDPNLEPRVKLAQINERVARAMQLQNGDVVFAPTDVEGRQMRDLYAKRRQVISGLTKMLENIERRDTLWRAGGESRRISADIDTQISANLDSMRAGSDRDAGAALSAGERAALAPFTGENANTWAAWLVPGQSDVAKHQIKGAIDTLQAKEEADLARTSKEPDAFVPYRELSQSREKR